MAATDGISGYVRGDAIYPYYLEACHDVGIEPLAQCTVLGALGKKVGKKRLRIKGNQVTCYNLPKRRPR